MNQSLRKALPLFLLLCALACLFLAPSASADGLADLQAAIAVDSDFTVSGELTIPQGTPIDASNIEITVPVGATLTVNDKLTVGGLKIGMNQNWQNGGLGAVVISDTGELHMTRWVDLGNGVWTVWTGNSGVASKITYEDDAGFILHRGDCATDLNALLFTLEDAERTVSDEVHGRHLAFEFGIPADNTPIDASAAVLRIPVGVTLTVNGALTVGDLDVAADGNGGRGYISIPEGGTMTVTKQTDIYNYLWDLWLDDGSADRIRFAEGAALILNRYVGSAGMGFDGLERAITDAGNYFDNSPDANLLFHIHIPEGTTVYALEGDYTEFTISDRMLLTVDGTLLADKFHDNGTVTVGEEGFLYAQSAFTIGEAVKQGMFTLSGTLSVEHDAYEPEQLKVLSIGEKGLVDISYNCETETAVLDVLNTENEPLPNFYRSIWVLFPWAMENAPFDRADTYTLPDQVRLCVPNEANGSLTIPEGKTLIIPDSGQILARGLNEQGDAVIQIDGALTNNGAISLERSNDKDHSGPAKMALGENGVYSGPGMIEVYDAANADEADTCLFGFPQGIFNPAIEEGNRFVYYSLLGELLSYIHEAEENPGQNLFFDMNGREVLAITEDLTIPKNLRMDFWGTLIIVAPGRALIVKGNLNTDAIFVMGDLALEDSGFVYVSDLRLDDDGEVWLNGSNTLYTEAGNFSSNGLFSFDEAGKPVGDERIHFGTNTPGVILNAPAGEVGEEGNIINVPFKNTLHRLRDLPEHYTGNIQIRGQVELSPDPDDPRDNGVLNLVEPKPVRLEIRGKEGGSLTIGNGTTLKTDFVDVHSGTLTVAEGGTLISCNEIKLRSDWDENGQMPVGKLIFNEDSSYFNDLHGYVRVENTETPEAQIEGWDWDRVSNPNWGLYIYDANTFFARFQDACVQALADPDTPYHFDLTNMGFFAIEDNLTIPANMTVDATNTTVEIPESKTLTVAGKLTMTRWITHSQPDSIQIPMGGELHIASFGQGLDLNTWETWMKDGRAGRVSFESGATIFLEKGGVDSEEALRREIENRPTYLDEHVNFRIPVYGSFESISNGLTVPSFVTLQIMGPDEEYDRRWLTIDTLTVEEYGAVSISSNALLNVEGGIILVGYLLVNNNAELYLRGAFDGLASSGNIVCSDGGHIVFHYFPEAPEAFPGVFGRAERLPGFAHGNIHIVGSEPVVLSSGLASERTDFTFKDTSITVPEGKAIMTPALYLENAELTVRPGGALNVRLLKDRSESRITLQDGSFATVGDLVLRGRLWISDQSLLEKLNLQDAEDFVCTEINNGWLYSWPGSYYTFADACNEAAEDPEHPHTFDLTNFDRFVVSDDLTIPANMTVNASGTEFVIAPRTTLTLSGSLTVTDLRLQPEFDENGQFVLGGMGSLVLTRDSDESFGKLYVNGWNELSNHIWTMWKKNGVSDQVFFGEDSGFHLMRGDIGNDDDAFKAALYDAAHLTDNDAQKDHLTLRFSISGEKTISEDTTIPSAANVTLNNDLTIAEGAVLTVDGTLSAKPDAAIIVNGALVNNGFVEVSERSEATGAMLVVNGKYSGTGSIGVKHPGDVSGYIEGEGLNLEFFDGYPDSIGTRFYLNMGRLPQLRMPDALTEIGEEAFAEGGFTFVILSQRTTTIGPKAFAYCPKLAYIAIPPETEVIYDTAFDGVKGLVIIGEPGSAAQACAAANGFSFFTPPRE